MSNKILTGSMCFTDIHEAAKRGHSAFQKAKNGKIYFNILQWINETKDEYGNDSSIQLNSKKDKKEEEGKIYVGNARYAEPEPIAATDVPETLDDLPF